MHEKRTSATGDPGAASGAAGRRRGAGLLSHPRVRLLHGGDLAS